MSDSFTLGVPMAPGSDNFSAVPPQPCDNALEEWTFKIGHEGIKAPPGITFDGYFQPGARLTFQNALSKPLLLEIPEWNGANKSGKVVDLGGGGTYSVTLLAFTVIMVNFTIICRCEALGLVSRLDCHICPTPIM